VRYGRCLTILFPLLTIFVGGLLAQQNDTASDSQPGTVTQGVSPEASQTPGGIQVPAEEGAGTPTRRLPPLSGATVLTPGSAGEEMNYLLWSMLWTGVGDTNTESGPGQSNLRTESVPLLNLTLQRLGRHSETNLDYSGGGFFYGQQLPVTNNIRVSPNNTIQRADVSDSLAWRRWNLLLSDQVAYLPESPLGFPGFNGLGSFNSGLGGNYLSQQPTTNPLLNPDQSLLTSPGTRVSNSFVTDLGYSLGARSTLTATGSYSSLTFLEPGFINSQYILVQAGFSQDLSSRDEFAIAYSHFFVKFNSQNHDVLDRGVVLTYGHVLSGRLSLQLSAGPSLVQIALPQGGDTSRGFLSTYDALKYRSGKYDASISFTRAITGGAGLLFGAETDLALASGGRRLWRRGRIELRSGREFGKSLTGQSPEARRVEFENWQGGLSLNREFSDRLSVFLGYDYVRQVQNSLICANDRCGDLVIRQLATVGVNWHGRPVRIH